MPHPDQYGRHPWIPSREAMPSLAELEKARYLAWTLRRGEPPRYWDEEYYANDGPSFTTARGYRFSLIDPPRIDLWKGFRL